MGRGQALRVLRCPTLVPVGEERGGRASRPVVPRDPPHIQDGGHLCGRIRRANPLHVRDFRGRGRGAARLPSQGGGAGGGSQPDRAGDRVRLLLRTGRLRPRGRRIRDGDGQLQSRDGLHRLRHFPPTLFRTPHGGGCSGCDRRRGSGGGDSAIRRADPAQPGEASRRGGGAHLGHLPGIHRSGRGS